MSEDTLRTRLYNDPPTPFTAADLEAICLAYGVRPDFLLLGRGPMLESDVMENGSGDRTFASAFRSHEIGVLQARTDQDEQWLESVIPPDDELLDAVDRGIQDAVEDALAAHVNDRKLVNQSIRLAVAAAVRARKSSPDIPNDTFRAAIGVVDGRVICPPSGAEGRE